MIPNDLPGRRPNLVPAALMLTAVLALALTMRNSANALGTLLPEIRADLGLSTIYTGALNALPTLVFAAVGLTAPMVAARLGKQATVVMSLLMGLAGQLLRVVVPSPTTLFLGTMLMLIGIAFGNVLLPAFVQQYFPNSIHRVSALYVSMLSIGSAAGSGATLPIQNGLGGDWRTGLGVWAGVTMVALLPWILVLVRGDSTRTTVRSGVPLRALVRSRTAWLLVFFFGIQAAQNYVLLGWMSQVLIDAGITAARMGILLAIIPVVGIPMALLVPMLMQRERRLAPMLIVFGICTTAGYVGILLAPTAGAPLWMLLLGLGGGTFPMCLTLIPLRSRTADGAVALSAFGQCLGYLIASLGPLTFGALHDLSGSWKPSMAMMVATMVPLVWVGLRLVRPRYVEDDLKRR